MQQQRPSTAKDFLKLKKEIIKTKAEMCEIATKKTTAKINKTKSWLSEKINKIDKPLARFTKKIKEVVGGADSNQ